MTEKRVELVGFLVVLIMAASAVQSLAQAGGGAVTAPPAKKAVAGAPAAQPAASQPAAAPQQPPSAFEQFLQEIKKPTPWLTWGFDERLRAVYSNNMLTLDGDTVGHEREWQRFRSRLWGLFTPAENLAIDTRATWEWRNWCNSYETGSTYSGAPGRGVGLANPSAINWDEVVFDRMNFSLKKLLDTPTTLTVGRQDLFFGNGWLVGDGTPLDGSRTFFLDAVRLTNQVNEKNKLDLIYIEQQAASDQWLSPINDQERNFTEQNERGAIAYWTNTSLEKTQIDVYYMWKHDSLPEVPPGAFPAQYPPFWARKSDIHAVGARAERTFDEHWKGRAEFAQEMGRQGNAGATGVVQDMQALCAFGFNGRLDYLLNDPAKNGLHVGYEYLSGDDPGTKSTDEGFDPLWGRWPQWSELYLYTWATETRIGEASNLHRVNLGWDTDLTPKWRLMTEYDLLFADENTGGNLLSNKYWGPDGGFSDHGKFRGQLLVAKLIYKYAPHITGHLWTEFFFPGNYYSAARNDPAVFLRYELMLTF